jgi:RNA polymerase sigma factor (sigma-70 family)
MLYIRVTMLPGEIAARALRVARATALGVLGDRDAADDVAQEVAIVAVRHTHKLRNPAALDAWLHKVTVRKALAAARRSRARRVAELAHHEARRTDTGDEQEILVLLADLPPRQRAALTLRYLHDLPDDAIARALGCRPGTVRSLLSRGREEIRRTHRSNEGVTAR